MFTALILASSLTLEWFPLAEKSYIALHPDTRQDSPVVLVEIIEADKVYTSKVSIDCLIKQTRTTSSAHRSLKDGRTILVDNLHGWVSDDPLVKLVCKP